MGYRLREVREEARMTQEELAAKAGVSRATIVAIESGSDKVTTTATIYKLAVALDTTVDRIFFSEPVKSIQHNVEVNQ